MYLSKYVIVLKTSLSAMGLLGIQQRAGIYKRGQAYTRKESEQASKVQVGKLGEPTFCCSRSTAEHTAF